MIPVHCESDDPVLKMLPMNWNFTPDGREESVDVPLSGLAEQAASIETLSAEFSALQQKFVAEAAPARRLPSS